MKRKDDKYLMSAPLDFYLLRSPLLPVDNWLDFNKILASPTGNLDQQLQQYFSTPALMEAIYIASPELYQQVEKWKRGLLKTEKENEKIRYALYKYLSRMCTRCTPYGLFAGCAVGTIAADTNIVLDPHSSHRKQLRLDMNYLATLADKLGTTPEIIAQLRFFTNNSIYKIGDKARYIEYNLNKHLRQYRLSAVDWWPTLQMVLDNAAQGRTIAELIVQLSSVDVAEQEAMPFIREMIDAQLLLSELTPTLSGPDPLDTLIHKLLPLQHTATCVSLLQQVTSNLQRADSDITSHESIKHILWEDFNLPQEKDFLQADLYLSCTTNTLSEKVVTQLQQDLEALTVFAHIDHNPHLETFRKEFTERYGDQEIPLTQALDAESGIGYANARTGISGYAPLLKHIPPAPTGTSMQPFGKQDHFRLHKYLEALTTGKQEIVITPEELALFGDKSQMKQYLPDSFYAHGQLLRINQQPIDDGHFRFYMNGFSGPSAVNLMCRFCNGSEILTEKVRACIAADEAANPGHIYAEIIHLPHARVGNILQHPVLRQYEIPFLTTPGVPPDQAIPIQDLMIRVEHNRIILRSQRLNKVVIPRLSNAHNYAEGNLALYQFLCDLQSQGQIFSYEWNWGILADRSFLPRVRYGHTVLSRACWKIQAAGFRMWIGNPVSQHTITAIQAWRQQHQVPRYILLISGDFELAIDMDSIPGITVLLKELDTAGNVILTEFTGLPEQQVVSGPDGHYCQELILPFRNVTKSPEPATIPAGITDTVPRSFITGSEWLYVKVYCGEQTAEMLLDQVVTPLIANWLNDSTITGFYFIRYIDTGYHLRLRFHNKNNPAFWTTVMSALGEELKPYLEDGLIHKVQTDTYTRELERYGSDTIEIAEQIFFYDSIAVLRMIPLLQGDQGESLRWLIAMSMVDSMLDDFGCSLPQKKKLAEWASHEYIEEMSDLSKAGRQLDDLYRKESANIRSWMTGTAADKIQLQEIVLDIISERSSAIGQLPDKPYLWDNPDTEAADMFSMVGSYVHMSVNRLFMTGPRKHELVIYYLLKKYYNYKIAIAEQVS